MYVCYDKCNKEVREMTERERPVKDRFTSYLTIDTITGLRELSGTTRVPQASLIEEAIQDLLMKYHGKLNIH
jgi:hypothetical protein